MVYGRAGALWNSGSVIMVLKSVKMANLGQPSNINEATGVTY